MEGIVLKIEQLQPSAEFPSRKFNLSLHHKLIGIVLAPNKTMNYLSEQPDLKVPLVAISLSTVMLTGAMLLVVPHGSVKGMNYTPLDPTIAKVGLISILIFALFSAVSSL